MNVNAAEQDGIVKQAQEMLALDPKQGAALVAGLGATENAVDQPLRKRRPPAPEPGSPESVVAGLQRDGKILAMKTTVAFDNINDTTLVYLLAADGKRSEFYGEAPGYYNVAGAMEDLRNQLETMLTWQAQK